MIGSVIGTYKIEQKLGEGGMGAVYKGVDTMLDREVAIKALKPELASQTAVVERFRSEAITLAKLHHPNIATLYSLFRQGDELYMVLEYVRGETLDEIMQRRGALTAEEVMPAFCQILDGINHAHTVGIIHRDIKPANIVMTENGTPKVLDFGIARLLGTNRMTRAGSIIGTLEYMSPEQVKGLETDARSDTYALGMMLYEVLTGHAPFETENEFELMKLQTECLPITPRSIKPSISEEIEAAIMRAIQKDPDARFQTAGEFRRSLVATGLAEPVVVRHVAQPAQTATATATQLAGQPISQPEILQPTPTADVIRETRFAAPAALSHLPAEARETRLGTGYTDPSVSVIEQNAPSSFLANLTWVHYAGAGSVAAVFLGFIIIVPLVFFSGVLSQGASNKAEPVNANPVNKPVRAAEAPTLAPPPIRSEPPPARTPEPVAVAPTPVDEPDEPKEPRDAPSTKRPTKRQQPVKTKKRAPPSAECALTGRC